VKEEITKALLDEAEAYLGCAVTYTLMEWVKENLEKLLAKQPLTFEACSDAVSSLHLEDKVNRHVKVLLWSLTNSSYVSQEDTTQNEKKERRVVLTKAQKRRQWDKMDGRGEKARGYNWVDVIKHLSQTGGAQATS
jgi:hypothetical protein